MVDGLIRARSRQSWTVVVVPMNAPGVASVVEVDAAEVTAIDVAEAGIDVVAEVVTGGAVVATANVVDVATVVATNG